MPKPLTSEGVRSVLADHFVMWHDAEDATTIRGEWRCACGSKFGFSDSAIDHVATAVVAEVIKCGAA